MPRFVTGKVTKLLESRDGIYRVSVRVGRKSREAAGFTAAGKAPKVGDKVVLNSTAVDMELGTGGQDFVLWNLERKDDGAATGGHVMKLRYTPWQLDTMVAEAPESPHHKALIDATSLEGMPVVVCGLHSQIAPAVAMLKHVDPDLRVAYLMTDGAALPIAHSDLVALLKDKGLIDATVTSGHAFGGDYESVNMHSGLMVASEVVGADVAVVSVGPGIVGTETALGHTGMEQGAALSAAGALGGRPVAALRVSFADKRERHQGVSHHSLTALRFGALSRSTVAVPDLEIERLTKVMEQLAESGVAEMHDLRIVDAWETKEVLAKFEIPVTTMGRTVDEDIEFFEAAGAAGLLATRFLYEVDEEE